MNVTMTIAGSDSGGGAGIQADLKTFQELNTFGTSAITALTAQNTLGVTGVHAAPPEFVLAQIEAVLVDFEVKAIKTGMLFSAEIIEVVAKRMADYHGVLVVDPVMIAKGGASLLQQQAVAAMRSQLLPVATVITPNIPEAEVLSGLKIETVADMAAAAQVLLDLGVKNVVMKGGHSQEEMAREYPRHRLHILGGLDRICGARLGLARGNGGGEALYSFGHCARFAVGSWPWPNQPFCLPTTKRRM